jgi:hypothetical protein
MRYRSAFRDEKNRVSRRLGRPKVQRLRDELRPVVQINPFRLAVRLDNFIQEPGDIGSEDLRRGANREAFSTKIPDQRKRSESTAIKESIRDEVHRPALVLLVWFWSLNAACRRYASARPLTPQTQAFLAIQPMDSILADFESFSLKQDVNPPVAITDPTLCEISNPLTKNDWILPRRLPSAARTHQGQDPTGSTFADLKASLHEGNEWTILSDL